MLHPNVISDERRFTFYITKGKDVREFIKSYMKQVGYGLYDEEGIDYIGMRHIRNDLTITGTIYSGDVLTEAFIQGAGLGSLTYSQLKQEAIILENTGCYLKFEYLGELYQAYC